jgi:cation diffusion facilitator CzcD-associated flavoprotein CzcO
VAGDFFMLTALPSSQWCSSRYPGARCDLPGPTYQFTWRYHVWNEHYPAAGEIQKYLSDVARENDFYKYIKFRHEIVGASWVDADAKWTLNIRDMEASATFEHKVDMFLEFNGPVRYDTNELLARFD